MAQTSPRAFKAALKTALEVDPDMVGVTIYTYTETEDSLPREYLILGDIEANDDVLAAQGVQLSSWFLSGESMVHQPAPDDAADRGWEILNAVQNALSADATVGSVVDAQMGAWSIDESIHPNYGRMVIVEFTIEVRDTNE